MKRIVAVLAVSGCFTPVHDANLPCTLVRGGGPDGGAVPIQNDDPEIAYSANRDIISFGGTDCSTRVCVRDAAFAHAPGPGPAEGYCSQACGPCAAGMECRALVLDEATLRALKAKDPERYRQLFGETEQPYFCIRER